jgi:hypothetical protein
MKNIAPALISASVFAIAATTSGNAQPADETQSETVDAMLACRSVDDDAQRLACLDAQLAELSQAIDSGRLVIVERSAIRAVERDGFGISLPSVSSLGSLFARSSDEAADEARSVEERTEVQEDGSEVIYAPGGGIEQMRGLPVRSVTTNRAGDLVVTLENGQVWVQSDTTRVRAPRRNEMDGLSASVEDGALSSFFMELSHTSRRFRVRRLQ